MALLINAAKQEYDESVLQGELPAAPDARVRITWVSLVIAVLLLPAVLAVPGWFCSGAARTRRAVPDLI